MELNDSVGYIPCSYPFLEECFQFSLCSSNAFRYLLFSGWSELSKNIGLYPDGMGAIVKFPCTSNGSDDAGDGGGRNAFQFFNITQLILNWQKYWLHEEVFLPNGAAHSVALDMFSQLVIC